MKTFQNKVREIVREIPKGRVASYGQVAIFAGSMGAARAVGTIMKNNDDSTVPCHRVVREGGCVGGYNGICGDKVEMLIKEGVEFDAKGRVKKEFFV